MGLLAHFWGTVSFTDRPAFSDSHCRRASLPSTSPSRVTWGGHGPLRVILLQKFRTGGFSIGNLSQHKLLLIAEPAPGKAEHHNAGVSRRTGRLGHGHHILFPDLGRHHLLLGGDSFHSGDSVPDAGGPLKIPGFPAASFIC